jgi:hypothetical protein
MKNKVVVFAHREENPFRLFDSNLFISQFPTKTEKQAEEHNVKIKYLNNNMLNLKKQVVNSQILKKVQKENK